MLTELNIRNFAIIDELKVAFDGGLNVISGETGAGKSIIIGAVGLLLGDRANADMIRSFEDAAVVEALFNIREHEGLKKKVCEMGFGDGQDLIVRRVVSRSGKHRVYINGALASLTSLAAIGESLINICGQHEHQMILDPENHTDILDEFGGLLPLRSVYGESYDRYLALKEKLRGLQELTRKKEEREDLLRFQITEISQADVRAGEDAALLEEKKVLANVQKLIDFAEGAYEILYGKSGSVLTDFRSATGAVKEIRKIDPALKLSDGEMDELYYRIEDAAFTLRDYAKRLSFDPARMEALEERLELLGRLKRKYGGTLDAVLRKQAEAEEELRNIASVEEEIGKLLTAIAAERGRLTEAGEVLSRRRREEAITLQAAIEAEIGALRMENARFVVVFRNRGEGDEISKRKGDGRSGILPLDERGRGAKTPSGHCLRRRALPDHARREEGPRPDRFGRDDRLRRSRQRHRGGHGGDRGSGNSKRWPATIRSSALLICRRSPVTATVITGW